jgi:tungstate transport system substrate-binding protein
MVAALFVSLLAVWGCGGNEAERTDLILATTTSTQDTGLLDEWIPMFEANNPYNTKVVAVGSGQAMQMGRDGECDVMLVHSPADEEKLVADGYAINRRLVMHNDFLIVGPPSDPAKISGMASAAQAFTAIANTQSKFISRGDNSGTNAEELSVWKAASITPSGNWYIQSGKGMGDTLRIASEQQAYTLADRGTWLAYQDQVDLPIMVQGDKVLFNVYHVMMVNPDKYPDINLAGAQAFDDWVVSSEAQEFLNTFGVDRYGQQLFYPDALSQ